MATSDPVQEALLCQRTGDWLRARAIYETLLKSQPRHVDALNQLGIILAQTGNPKRAVALFDRAVAADPRNAAALGNRGLALQALGQWEAALESLNRALVIRPGFAQACFNRGNVLMELDRLQDALASYEQATSLKADYAEAYLNRGVVLRELGQLGAAVASFDRAIRLRPGYASAYLNKSFALLLRGDFAQGWPLYEWRRKLDGAITERRAWEVSRPCWLGGGSIAGKTILLHAEQGFGDTLQFCRYAAIVAGLGARVIAEVQPPLLPLLSGLEGVAQTVARGTPLAHFDWHCPMMSLPLALKTTLGTIPCARPYLHADPAKVAGWRRRLGEKTQPWVGLVWSGSATHKRDRNRSIALAQWLPHLPPGPRYVSLQKELREPDRRSLRAAAHIRHHGADLHDFSDTAALCECLDIVISVDTSVAHLAAALGRKTWILLPAGADWRWLLERADSPWYPSATLYRQGAIRGWDDVLARVASDLTRALS
ncbi:MAG TPA: tetratricopeptide repeat-containing glycosyltransferase family protein [Steroidobacteraceae bacterium]|nr:tetratricopeptide repeat-containing glycosyltransferase family protein [Steroidobacteraceae bacterium]